MKINVNYRNLSRFLKLLLVLVVFIVVVYSVFKSCWIIREKKYSDKSHSNQQKSDVTQEDYTQSPPTLESSIINVTPVPVINWNKISKSRLPWYFKDGLRYPERDLVDNKTGVRISKLWPEEHMLGDRVEEQLMFVPPHYKYENAPLKNILLYNDHKNWMIEDGQIEFLSNGCPVDRCKIIRNAKYLYEADAVVFRNNFIDYELSTSIANQVRIFYIQQSAYYTKLDNISANFINWTVSYRHDSDIVVPYRRWAYYNNPLVTQREQLQRNYAQNKKKLIAAVIMECDTDNGRILYVRELNKHIAVDIYGQCGDYNYVISDTFFKILGQDYRYYLAFEDSNCINYITEKFFVEGLGYDMLPIVMGARREDYELVAPHHSYLHVDDFESPEELSKYLFRLSNDDELYNEYFRWKGSGEFIDTRFFCRLCAMLHDESAPVKHYHNVIDWWRRPDACDHQPARRWKTPGENSSQPPEVRKQYSLS